MEKIAKKKKVKAGEIINTSAKSQFNGAIETRKKKTINK